MNKVLLTGRLTAAPEIKVTNSGVEVMSFGLAVDRGVKDKATGNRITDFINCVAWRKTATFINAYFKKGDGIEIEGSIETRKYVDKNGDNRIAFEINVEKAGFTQGKARDTEPSFSAPTVPSAPSDDSQNFESDDDLPF